MAVALVTLITLLPLVLLVADLVRPHKGADQQAGPSRGEAALTGAQTAALRTTISPAPARAPAARPARAPRAGGPSSSRLTRRGHRGDFFGDHLADTTHSVA